MRAARDARTMSKRFFRTGLLLGFFWVVAVAAATQPGGMPQTGAPGAELQLERAERVHRIRLGQLRRLYELAREHKPAQVARVLELARAEQDRHARQTAAARARLSSADLEGLDRRLNRGRTRSGSPVLPEELLRRMDKPQKKPEPEAARRPLTRRQQEYRAERKRQAELREMRAGAKEREKERRRLERSTKPQRQLPKGKKIKTGRKKKPKRDGLNGGMP